jgi:hypothetical protein
MNFKTNQVTGNQEAQFTGKLLSISEQVLENMNGTSYRVGTVEFKNAQGAKVQRSGLIYESNYSTKDGEVRMSAGNDYLCTAIITEGREDVLITISHLTGASRASKDDFGFVAEPKLGLQEA